MQQLKLVGRTGQNMKERIASINEVSHEAISIYINCGRELQKKTEVRYLCP
jgi:site-specific recombinase XerD